MTCIYNTLPICQYNKTLEYVNDLNKIYNRFNRHDFSKCIDHVKNNASRNKAHLVCTNEQIHKEFKRLRPSKALGPDGIPLEILRCVVVSCVKYSVLSLVNNFCVVLHKIYGKVLASFRFPRIRK